MKTLRIAVLLVGSAWAIACGPYFNDAHRSLNDPLAERFRDFYHHVLGGEGRIRDQQLDPVALRQQRDDDDLIAAGLDREAPVVAAYRDQRDQLDLVALEALAETDGTLAAFGRSSLIRSLLWQGDVADIEWAQRLERARGLLAADGVTAGKTEELAYLRVYLPVFAQLVGDPWHDLDAVTTAIEDLTAFRRAHSESAWSIDALGWIAHCRYRYRALFAAAGRVAEGVPAATGIYHDLLREPRADYLRAATIESLYFCYRDMPGLPEERFTDPRHALAMLYHRSYDPGDDQDSAVVRRLATLAADAIDDGLADGWDAPTLHRFAVAFLRADRPAEALICADTAENRVADPAGGYLAARALVALGRFDEAWERFSTLGAAGRLDRRRCSDLGMRLGAAYEELGEWHRALRAYVYASSWVDWTILVDGVMPLEELQALVDTSDDLRAFPAAPADEIAQLPSDMLPRIREGLGVRLARAGRYRQALDYLPAERAAAVRTLLELQAELEAAAAPERPAALYRLASHWYGTGQHIVYFDNDWHHWAWRHGYRGGLTTAVADRAAAEANMRAMTAETYALPLFERVYHEYPDSPEAPKALYSAGCCWYWLIRPRYTTACAYWSWHAEHEGYMERGHSLMRRLQRRYPDHPLSQSDWIREKVPPVDPESQPVEEAAER